MMINNEESRDARVARLLLRLEDLHILRPPVISPLEEGFYANFETVAANPDLLRRGVEKLKRVGRWHEVAHDALGRVLDELVYVTRIDTDPAGDFYQTYFTARMPAEYQYMVTRYKI